MAAIAQVDVDAFDFLDEKRQRFLGHPIGGLGAYRNDPEVPFRAGRGPTNAWSAQA